MMNHCVWQLNILSFIVPVSPSCDARRPLLCGSGFMATWHLWGRLYFLPSFLKSQAVPEHLDPTFLSLQKDSHTLYLEQELDSLKVVLDIKNKQLHQQEKKMMEIDKLVRPEAHKWLPRHQDKKRTQETLESSIILFFFSLFSRQRKMWSWMRTWRRSSRRMRSSKLAWKDMLHCQGKFCFFSPHSYKMIETRLWSI